MVPRYEISASAGGGAAVYSEQIVDYLAFKTDWVRDHLRLPPEAIALINVTGDSMEPALSDGDLAGDAVFFRLDFHRQRNQLARFKIDREGTIIVYRGRQERGRSVGEADGITLRRLIEGAK